VRYNFLNVRLSGFLFYNLQAHSESFYFGRQRNVMFGRQMYPYHNKIKQRIINNELIRYEYVDAYKNISPCLLLHFHTDPRVRPIREHRFAAYEALFQSIKKA